MGRLLLYHLVFLFVATKGALIVEPNLRSLSALLDLCLKKLTLDLTFPPSLSLSCRTKPSGWLGSFF